MVQLNIPAENIKKAEPGQKKRTPKNERKQPRPPRKITESYLHNSGLYYLERYAASTAHFKKVMMRKIDRSCKWHQDQDRETCAKMLDDLTVKFQELGLLNDEAYARGMVQSLRRRGLSGRMIRAKLSAKGLESEETEQALSRHAEELDTEENVELIAALRLAKRKRIGPYRREDSEIEEAAYNKALGAMARAGLGFDICKRVLDMDTEEALRISESGDW